MRSPIFTLGLVASLFALTSLSSTCVVKTAEPEPEPGTGGNGGGEGGGGEGGGAPTGALISLERLHASIEVGGDTAVIVNLENVPESAHHMYTSDTEYFTLVASSDDAGAVLMFNELDAQPNDVRLDWESAGEDASAPTAITGLIPGTVTFVMGQVTDSPIAFGEAYTGSSDVTISVTPGTGTTCADFSGDWTMYVSKISSACGPELDWFDAIAITQTDCSTSTTGIKGSTDPVSGTASGFTITIGPGDYPEGEGTTNATYVMAAPDDPPTEMAGVERWSWATSDPSDACEDGVAVLYAIKQ